MDDVEGVIMGKHRFEVLLVIETDTSETGRQAANAAWCAADEVEGASVINDLASERLPDGGIAEVGWPDWSDEPDMQLRVHYENGI